MHGKRCSTTDGPGGDEAFIGSRAGKAPASGRSFPAAPRRPISAADAALGAAATGIASGLGWLAERWLDLDELSPIFMVAVVVVAARTRMAAAVLTSVLCFLAYNFIFIEPRLTLFIGARQGVATIFFFLIAALVAGRLASRLHTQVLALSAANVHANALRALGRELSTAANLEQVIAAARAGFKATLGAEVAVFISGLPQDGGWMGQATQADREALAWTQSHAEASGGSSGMFAESGWWFLPLRGHPSPIGTIGLRLPSSAERPTPELHGLAEAMVEDVAQAAIRANLVAELENVRVSAQSERLRSALLSSVSHDLRSPLAAIIGAASSLDSPRMQ